MFSLKIVGSDAFLEMPTSARELYFQLGMYADDDGFVNPRKIMRMIGSSEDDIKVLISKRFVLPFDNGVVVIKHWLINNLVRKDFYQETMYLDQKKTLEIKANKAYTNNVNNLSPQDRLGKDRILPAKARFDVVQEDTKPQKVSNAKYPHALEVFSWFPDPQRSWEALRNVQEREYGEFLYARGESTVRGMLTFCGKYGHMEYFPSWRSPSKLEKNWQGIQDFAERNNI